jgi:hypothetical protein
MEKHELVYHAAKSDEGYLKSLRERELKIPDTLEEALDAEGLSYIFNVAYVFYLMDITSISEGIAKYREIVGEV